MKRGLGMNNGCECDKSSICTVFSGLFRIQYVFLFLVFIGITIFFTCVHPVILYDADDWYNISYMRNVALPKWGAWNPIKVLPETLMPLCGLASAYLVTPILGDYLQAVTLVTAVVISVAVTVYTGIFFSLIRKAFSLSGGQAAAISLMFLMFHFLIFKSHNFDNPYLFQAINLTCCYHYVIPGLLNASLVMYFIYLELESGDFSSISIASRPFLLLAVYFAIFSNILISIILISWLASTLLIKLFGMKGKKDRLLSVYRDNMPMLWIIAVWLVSLLFEANGGRAHQIGHGITWASLMDTVTLITAFVHTNSKGLLIFITAFALFTGGAAFLKRRSSERREDDIYRGLMCRCVIASMVWLIYLVAVSTKAGAAYVVEPGVPLGIFFFLFIVAMGAAAYITARWSRGYPVMLLLSFCILCRTLDAGYPLMNSNYENLTADVCVAVDRDIMAQIIANQHEEHLVATVPVGNKEGNWPHPEDFAKRMAVTLYRHGQILHMPKDIESHPDSGMNEKHRIAY